MFWIELLLTMKPLGSERKMRRKVVVVLHSWKREERRCNERDKVLSQKENERDKVGVKFGMSEP